MPPEVLTLRRQGRSAVTGLVLLVVYSALTAALIGVQAAPWLVALLVLPTLPALWDLIRNPVATLQLDSRRLSWASGRRAASVELDEIARMRFDTRWDMSVRVTAALRSGRKLRLPQECLPPHKQFEAALLARSIPVERHHFRVF